MPAVKKYKKYLIAVIVVLCLALACVGIIHFQRNYLFYDIDFVIEDPLPDGEGKSATVILLGGQSNASGCIRDDYLQKNISEEKYAEYKNGYDNVYINYYCTGTNESRGFVKCAAKQGEAGGYFGPELGLAEKLYEMYPDEQFFIIKYAWGGSNLHNQWISPSGKGATGNLYKNFVRFVEQSMEHLEEKNYEVKIAGMCWMQGESDALSVETATDYKINLIKFMKDLRKRLDCYTADGEISFVDALIAENPALWTYCDLVNASKREVAEISPMTALIDTNAAGLVCTEEPEEKPDIPHYDSLSEIKLGHLFAEELSKLNSFH